jgi:hypothetical protein
LQADKPAYVVAAEAGINHSRLLDYANARVEMSGPHQLKLARYFGVDAEELYDDDVTATDGTDVAGSCESDARKRDFECTAIPVSVRATRKGDVSVRLRVTASELAPWSLLDAPEPVRVWTVEWRRNDDGKHEAWWIERCEALVEDVHSSGGQIVVRLTVPRSEQDMAFWHLAPRRDYTGEPIPIDVRITSLDTR